MWLLLLFAAGSDGVIEARIVTSEGEAALR
jgi:hypothetical protein